MLTTLSDAKILATGLLVSRGLSADSADRTAWAMVTADAWGKGSHGLLRLPHYLRRLDAGGIDPVAEMALLRDTGPLAAFDGHGGMGHYQAYRASELATEKAKQFGVSLVSVANSNHCGVLGLYVLEMVKAEMIGLAFTNGPAVMPAWGGNTPLVSTSPIAAGIPMGEEAAIIDLATSTVARGKIAQAASKGETIPDGWAFDASGTPTNDAKEALNGMLAPMAGAKGFALALMVEALTGGIVGPSLSSSVADPLSSADSSKPQRVSHLLMAIDPAATDPSGGAAGRLYQLATSITGSGGRIPGARNYPAEGLDQNSTVELSDSVAKELAAFAEASSLPLPPSWRGAVQFGS